MTGIIPCHLSQLLGIFTFNVGFKFKRWLQANR
jgi:hypothetical protein